MVIHNLNHKTCTNLKKKKKSYNFGTSFYKLCLNHKLLERRTSLNWIGTGPLFVCFSKVKKAGSTVLQFYSFTSLYLEKPLWMHISRKQSQKDIDKSKFVYRFQKKSQCRVQSFRLFSWTNRKLYNSIVLLPHWSNMYLIQLRTTMI